MKNISIKNIIKNKFLKHDKDLQNLEILLKKIEYTDLHCHLDYEPMSQSLRETIQRARDDGVNYILTISTKDKSFNKILK